jgi:hypothetical protein
MSLEVNKMPATKGHEALLLLYGSVFLEFTQRAVFDKHRECILKTTLGFLALYTVEANEQNQISTPFIISSRVDRETHNGPSAKTV